jgi:predicted amidohydrolase
MNKAYSRASLLALFLSIAPNGFAAERAIAFRRANVETAAKAGRMENVTLVVRDGKIEALAADAAVPDDAKIVDAAGKTIVPGFIDPFWTESDMSRPTGGRGVISNNQIIPLGDLGSAGGAFSRTADDFQSYDRKWKALSRDGLTHIQLAATNYGQGAFIRVNPELGDEMVVNPDGLLFVSVSNDSASLDRVRQALETADRFKKGPVAPQAAAAIASGAAVPITPPGQRPPMPSTVPTTPPAQAPTTPSAKMWLAAYEGKAPVVALVNTPAAVSHLLKIAEPYKDVKWVLAGPAATFIEIAHKLKGKPIKVVLRPGIDRMPNTRDRVNVARLLHDGGVEVIFTHVSAAPAVNEEMPLFPVAMAVKGGLPRQTAVEAMTIRPATLLGVEKTHGSLEVGKSASFVVFDGDPFEADSRLRQVYVEGKLVHED